MVLGYWEIDKGSVYLAETRSCGESPRSFIVLIYFRHWIWLELGGLSFRPRVISLLCRMLYTKSPPPNVAFDSLALASTPRVLYAKH